MRWPVAWLWWMASAGFAAPSTLPACGLFNHDLGGGYALFLAMENEFSLFDIIYTPPPQDIEVFGGRMITAPKIRFFNLSAPPYMERLIGYEALTLKDVEGTPFALRKAELDCGGGVSLSVDLSNAPKPRAAGHYVPGGRAAPLNLGESELGIACFAHLRQGGYYRLTLDGEHDVRLVAEGRLHLDEALRAAGRLVRQQTMAARQGKCPIP